LLDEERRRIARELHDRVAQTFFSIGLAAQTAIDEARANQADVGPGHATLEGIRGLSALGTEQMREAIFSLAHADVQDRALARMLWQVVRDFRERTALDADLVVVGQERRLPREAAEALLAVAREGLANVEQHAHARNVVVSLRTTATGVTLAVHDDGVGAPALVLRSIGSSVTHFGLRGLQERVKRLRGSFTVRRGEDGGLLMRVRLPTT
jgi:signal transduction histidine kinase